MNTNAKGYRSEQKTVKYLEDLGYVVCTTQRSSHRGNNDFFNAFDHIAISSGKKVRVLDSKTKAYRWWLQDVILVQTRSNRKGDTTKIKELADNTVLKDRQNCIFIFVWKDREAEPYIYTHFYGTFVKVTLEAI